MGLRKLRGVRVLATQLGREKVWRAWCFFVTFRDRIMAGCGRFCPTGLQSGGARNMVSAFRINGGKGIRGVGGFGLPVDSIPIRLRQFGLSPA